MEQSIKVGETWFAKEEPELELEIFDVSGDTVSCKLKTDWFGYLKDEVVTYTKSQMVRFYEKQSGVDYQKGYQDGYRCGHTDGKNESFQDKEASEMAEREMEARKVGYQEGYAQAYNELYAPTTERERQLKEEAWDEGYVSAIEDYLAQGDEFVGNVGCYEFGAVADWEHTPNKETQEAMQEVLDKDSNEFVGIWVSKKHNPDWKLEYYSDCGTHVWMKVLGAPVLSVYIVGDLFTMSKESLKKDYTKILGDNSVNIFNTEDEQLEKELALVEKYPHYYKDIRHLNILDIYRFFDLFEVTDPCIQHSLKKMAVGGKRGSKDYEKDIKEAMDTLNRWEYMQEENKRGLDD